MQDVEFNESSSEGGPLLDPKNKIVADLGNNAPFAIRLLKKYHLATTETQAWYELVALSIILIAFLLFGFYRLFGFTFLPTTPEDHTLKSTIVNSE